MKIETPGAISADFIVSELCSDTYDDAEVLRDKYFRWLFRVWSDLNFDFIRTKRDVILPISSATKTVLLPADYQDFIFLGYPDDCGNLLPLNVNLNLAPAFGVENMNQCKKCGKPDLCNGFASQTETTEDVVINGTTYQKVTTRIIHMDGSYSEEVTEPVAHYDGSVLDGVEMHTSSSVICQLQKTCDACVEATPGNLALLAQCGCIEAVMCCSTDMLPKPVIPDIGHYNLFEQEGFIQFSPHTCLRRVWLKYISKGICKNGIWYFPEICMNTLIDGTYLFSIEKKKNVPEYEKNRALRRYIGDKKGLMKRFTRLSGQEFLEIINQIPRLASL